MPRDYRSKTVRGVSITRGKESAQITTGYIAKYKRRKGRYVEDRVLKGSDTFKEHKGQQAFTLYSKQVLDYKK